MKRDDESVINKLIADLAAAELGRERAELGRERAEQELEQEKQARERAEQEQAALKAGRLYTIFNELWTYEGVKCNEHHVVALTRQSPDLVTIQRNNVSYYKKTLECAQNEEMTAASKASQSRSSASDFDQTNWPRDVFGRHYVGKNYVV